MLPWFGRCLSWQVGDDHDVFIGIDSIIEVTRSLSIPDGLRTYLEDLDITTLSQACNTMPGTHHYWLSAEALYIAGNWKTA